MVTEQHLKSKAISKGPVNGTPSSLGSRLKKSMDLDQYRPARIVRGGPYLPSSYKAV